MPSKFYCPSTELSKGDSLARGTEDDDFALLKRRVDPKKDDYFHFMVWTTLHRDFAIGLAQIEPVSRAAVSVSRDSDSSGSDYMGGRAEEDKKYIEIARKWEFFFRDSCAHFSHQTDNPTSLRKEPDETWVIAPALWVEKFDHVYLAVTGNKMSIAVSPVAVDEPEDLKWILMFESPHFQKSMCVPFVYFADNDDDTVKVMPCFDH